MNQEDKDLILLSADAFGMEIEWNQNLRCFIQVEALPYYIHWNPLCDSDHTLKLLSALYSRGFKLEYSPGGICATVSNPVVCVEELRDGRFSPEKSTRRAIVRAAAEVQKILSGDF